MDDRLLSGSLAARLLGVSGTTVCAWVRQGRLAGYIDGKVCRVWESSVMAKTGRARRKRRHNPVAAVRNSQEYSRATSATKPVSTQEGPRG
jgi:excisionase family DNA binding protein